MNSDQIETKDFLIIEKKLKEQIDLHTNFNCADAVWTHLINGNLMMRYKFLILLAMAGIGEGCGNSDSKFTNVVIPNELNITKPLDSLTSWQIDSVLNLEVNQEQILVVGSGYTGYDFFMWHKPVEKGELYIKAIELTQNIVLSEEKLFEQTKNSIQDIDTEYKLYRGSSVIYEGTFEEYYPVIFELWFRSSESGHKVKLAESKYLIDGWDR